MEVSYFTSLPYFEIKNILRDEKNNEFWLLYAYFSKNKIKKVLQLLESRNHKATVHLILSDSSVNPLHDIVNDIIYMSNYKWFHFHLVSEPLMHAKIFAARSNDKISIYIGSANLTSKAENSNIESGIFIRNSEDRDILSFLKNIAEKCVRYDSIEILLRKAVLAHFRSEILFLALEESKVRQAISVKPEKIKSFFSGQTNKIKEEKTVTLETKKTLNIFILDTQERERLLESETKLKTSIKENCAIKIDGYGHISSLWSIKKILKNDNVKSCYDDFIKVFKDIRETYKNEEYRLNLLIIIENSIIEYARDNNININEEVKLFINKELKTFALPHSDPKSPYRKLERLYSKIVDQSNLLTLLNPYKIGDDSAHQTADMDDFEILGIDQVNLLVMCHLAIKLRSSPGKAKMPKPPSVWWFDIALDEYFYEIDGCSKKIDYKNKSKYILEQVQSEIYNGVDINNCLEKFCNVTGFNLGITYPIIHEVVAWIDDDEDDEPIVFIPPLNEQYRIFNFKLDNNPEIEEIMLFIDEDKLSKEWELNKSDLNCLTTMKGEFVLGENIRFYAEPEEAGKYAFIYVANS